MYDLVSRAVRLANITSTLIEKCPNMKHNILIQTIVDLAKDLQENYHQDTCDFENGLEQQFLKGVK